MTMIDTALKNLEEAVAELKAALIQEEILTETTMEDGSEELVTNQSKEAREAFLARKWADIRL